MKIALYNALLTATQIRATVRAVMFSDPETRSTWMRLQRTDRGFTRRSLGDLIGVSEGTIRRLEAGDEVPRATTGKKLADFYGVKVSDIWGAL